MADIIEEVTWLSASGVQEIVLVSENSTSYGKDFGDIRALEHLLPRLDAETDIARIRVAYLQPAEIRPGLLEVMAATGTVADAFDISFQHASPSVLRRMRRFGGRNEFAQLVEQIRALAPQAGIRSNFIVGFPGETEQDFAAIVDFLTDARLDAVGVFGFSAEDDTEAASFDDQLASADIADRVLELTSVATALMDQRASDRVGDLGMVLIESRDDDEELGVVAVGRAAHQNPDDGATLLPQCSAEVGDFVSVQFIDSRGPDLIGVQHS